MSITDVLADSTTNLTGWISNGRFFFNKPEALLYATAYKTDIRYYYNDHVFENYDWSIEPTESLDELYRQRALELRDRYDYIIALFSGGSDSTNMVRTFLNNNILLDEVVSYGAWNNCMDFNDKCNIEVTFSAKPVINEILKSTSKFTHLNLFDQFNQAYTNSDWILSSDTYMAAYTDFVQKSLYSMSHVRKLIDQGKKVCYLWGLEKPNLVINNDTYHLIFADQRYNSNQYGDSQNKDFDQVWFYSDVACTKLIAKQAHSLINYYNSHFQRKEIFDLIMSFQKHTVRESNIVNTILYPTTWDNSTFSLGKNKSTLHSQKWTTFETQMQESSQYQNWIGGVNDFMRSIDPKFLSTNPVFVIKPFVKVYPIKAV